MTKPQPLGLTDSQFSQLLAATDQVHRADRDRFLRTIAHRFSGRREPPGDGEFAIVLRELLHGGFFRPPAVVPHGPIRCRRSKLRTAAPIP